MRIKILLLLIVGLLISPAALSQNSCVSCLTEAADQGAGAYEECMSQIGDDALCQQQMWWVSCQYGQGHCYPCSGVIDFCSRVGGRAPTLP